MPDDEKVKTRKSPPIRYETAYAHAAFEFYAAMGPDRSLPKMSKVWKNGQGSYQSKLRWLSELSRCHHWQDRVKIYDQKKIEEKAKRREDRWERLNHEQDEIASRARGLAMQVIEELVNRRSLGGQNAVALLKLGLDTERVAVKDALGESKGNDAGKIQIVIMTDSDDTKPKAISGPIVTVEAKEL